MAIDVEHTELELEQISQNDADSEAIETTIKVIGILKIAVLFFIGLIFCKSPLFFKYQV